MLSRPPISSELQETQDVFLASTLMPRKTVMEMREEQLADPEICKIIDAFGDEPVDVPKRTDQGYILTNGVLYRYDPI